MMVQHILAYHIVIIVTLIVIFGEYRKTTPTMFRGRRSDFSSSASAKSGNPRGNRACSAAESALKLVDLSRIGQIPVNSNSEVPEVLIENSKKPENLRTFEFSNFRTQFSVE